MTQSTSLLWRLIGAVYVFFLLTPLVLVVSFAFTNRGIAAFPIEHLSLRWWGEMVAKPEFLPALKNSVVVGVTVVAPSPSEPPPSATTAKTMIAPTTTSAAISPTARRRRIVASSACTPGADGHSGSSAPRPWDVRVPIGPDGSSPQSNSPAPDSQSSDSRPPFPELRVSSGISAILPTVR